MPYVACNTVDLTLAQRRTLGEFLPLKGCLIEQWKTYGANRVTTKTYVRVGTGSNAREWLLQRNGRAIENPTPGRGTPK